MPHTQPSKLNSTFGDRSLYHDPNQMSNQTSDTSSILGSDPDAKLEDLISEHRHVQPVDEQVTNSSTVFMAGPALDINQNKVSAAIVQ